MFFSVLADGRQRVKRRIDWNWKDHKCLAPVKKHPKYLILDLLAANQVVQGLHFQESFLFNIIVKCEIGLSICNYKLIENKF